MGRRIDPRIALIRCTPRSRVKNIGTLVHEAHALTGQAQCLLRDHYTTQAIALLRQAHSLYDTLGVPEAIEIQTMLSTLDNQTAPSPDQSDTTS